MPTSNIKRTNFRGAGVLNNDDRKIGGDISRIPEPSCEDSNKDLEKAEPITPRGLFVKWPSVKIIDINEIVDNTFMEKIRGWAYSRIPVVGKPNGKSNENTTTTTTSSDWEGTQVFGFLHIKVSLAKPAWAEVAT